jgi:ATP-dependent exoDNAse (exonuclease V) beta subunit
MLNVINFHKKDDDITFEEEGHIYHVHGDNTYTSITTLIHSMFEKFDSSTIIHNMLLNKKRMEDPSYKYYNMDYKDIYNLWELNGKIASEKGTAMHLYIENYYNNRVIEDSDHLGLEYTYFKKFVQEYYYLKPYRTEWTVFYSKYKLCGSIDMVFENSDGTLQIYDWKRVKSIEYDAYQNKCAIVPCINHITDSNFWHYSLQLNFYKCILEEQYDKKVTGMYLIILHPENTGKNFYRVEVPDLSNDIQNILKWRLSYIELN